MTKENKTDRMYHVTATREESFESREAAKAYVEAYYDVDAHEELVVTDPQTGEVLYEV